MIDAQFNSVKDFAESGTLNHPVRSLGFFPQRPTIARFYSPNIRASSGPKARRDAVYGRFDDAPPFHNHADAGGRLISWLM
jgi:hypothetical protein